MSDYKEDKQSQRVKKGREKYLPELEKQIHLLEKLQESLELDPCLDDAQEYYRIVHKIKGSAPMFGFIRAGLLAEDLSGEWEWTEENSLPDDLAGTIQSKLLESKKILLQLKIEHDQYQKELLHAQEHDLAGKLSNSIPSPSIGGHILIVDDDDLFRQFLVDRLSLEGYHVDEANSVRAAKRKLTEKTYDLITLDLVMYPESGYQLFHFLNEDPTLKWIPLIVLSGKNDVEDKIKCLRSGADDYVAKPFEFQELSARIYRLITRSKQFEYMAFRDPLTGVFNRRYFDLQLKSELNRVQRYTGDLTVAIIDVDHFKKVNDTYGHHVGDLILQALCYILQSNIRATDILARLGGEEFVLLFPQTSAEQVQYIIEKVMQGLRKEPITKHEGEEYRITFSAGIAEWKEGIEAAELIRQADEALYEAKNKGRDQVQIYSQENNQLVQLEETPKKKVLLVDDDEMILSILKSKLKELPIKMMEAQDGEEAFELLRRETFDLCIIDGIMPKLDGFSLVEKIKQDPACQQTKILMLSGRKKEEDIVKGLLLGANDYMSKPFSLVELEIRVKRLLHL